MPAFWLHSAVLQAEWHFQKHRQILPSFLSSKRYVITSYSIHYTKLYDMKNVLSLFKRKKILIVFLAALTSFFILLYSFNKAVSYTSTDQYCNSCHVHDHADDSWRLSPHANNNSGVVVHCSDCHLPPRGDGYIAAKIYHGSKDLYGYWFKDSADYKWASKRTAEIANQFTYQSSCIKCHSNLFPANLSSKGADSHRNNFV